MAQIINTNVASLNTQRNLNSSQAMQASAIQRLSSGLRINSAKDDAAGLAIAGRFTAEIRGLNQAVRNSQDAVSLAQTAEGALASVGNNLQRMRELAVQSANGTNSSSDRAALQVEFDQLRQEINRVAAQTSFNGVKLLDGSFTNVAFQVGANASETISINSIVNANATALGTYTAASVTSAAAGTFTAIAGGAITITGSAGATTLGAIGVAASAQERAGQVRDAINAVASQTGVYAVNDTNTTVTLRSSGSITVAGAVVGTSGLTNATTAASTQTGFGVTSIATVPGANEAMNAMDAAMVTVSTARANLGAVQNRFESTISNLQTTSENLSASRSRIQDADYAEETSKLTRAQILQQAGVAMLAQANALPQNVLALLRG